MAAEDTTTLEGVENVVLRQVREKEQCRPLELLESLRHAGYSDAELKLALAELLDSGKIELTSKRVLHAGAGV